MILVFAFCPADAKEHGPSPGAWHGTHGVGDAHTPAVPAVHALQIVEQGTHAQLLAQGGRYAQLVWRQRGPAAEASESVTLVTAPGPVQGSGG